MNIENIKESPLMQLLSPSSRQQEQQKRSLMQLLSPRLKEQTNMRPQRSSSSRYIELDIFRASAYQQTQQQQECILVAIINAAIFYGYQRPSVTEYQELLHDSGCRYGSCLKVTPALQYYHLQVQILEETTDISVWKQHLPLLVGVKHNLLGHHLVAIVGLNGYKLLVPNFKEVTDDNGWVTYDIFLQYLTLGQSNILPLRGKFWRLLPI